ncbi:MAG: hypothetical protein FJ288_06170 [Planctomycetes bacterium]|nr:hypothetical protein [Planctomycetota bacterium]
MTPRQTLVLAAIAAAAAAALVGLHLALPVTAAWQTNRILHYAWMAAAGLAAAGGIVWLMWPRPRQRRRDFDRAAARRKVVGLGAVVIVAIGVVVFGEMHAEVASRKYLEPEAAQDLQAVAQALAAYAADHGGARPAAVEALAPKYLDPARLHYAYRRGPARSGPPAPDAAEAPSYAIVRELPGATGAKRSDGRIVAYLRPGQAWARLTVILEEGGRWATVGEDAVRTYEAEPRP